MFPFDPITLFGGAYVLSFGARALVQRRRAQQAVQQVGLEDIPEVRVVHLANMDAFLDTLDDGALQAFVASAELGERVAGART